MSNKKQFLWGVVAGVITFGLMGVSYYVGVKAGEEKEPEVVEKEVQLTEREVRIDIKSACEGFTKESIVEGAKSIKTYCVGYEEGANVLNVLKELDEQDETFTFSYEDSQFGAFVTSINNYLPDISKEFWSFKINGELSMVGVSDYAVQEGDVLTFVTDMVEM